MIERDAPVWNATDWDALLHHVRDGLPSRIARIGALSASLLRDLHHIEQLLADRGAPKFSDTVGDIRYQLDSLVYPGFLTGVGARNLSNVARYLAAVEHRLDRLPEHPGRDRDAMVRVQRLDREHDRLIDRYGWTGELEAIVWQLQELRVSLFAQHLGTAGQVSEKRIRAALEAVAST